MLLQFNINLDIMYRRGPEIICIFLEAYLIFTPLWVVIRVALCSHVSSMYVRAGDACVCACVCVFVCVYCRAGQNSRYKFTLLADTNVAETVTPSPIDVEMKVQLLAFNPLIPDAHYCEHRDKRASLQNKLVKDIR